MTIALDQGGLKKVWRGGASFPAIILNSLISTFNFLRFKIIILLFLPFVFFEPSFAQPRIEWLRTYNGPLDRGGVLYDVFATEEGGFAMTGSVSGDERYCWLLVTNRDGGVIHQSSHPRAFENPICEGKTIIQDVAGGYLIGGSLRSRDLTPARFGLIRTDEEGELIWWREYAIGMCYAVIEEKAGNFIACGIGRIGQASGAFVVKCDVDGDTIWTKLFENETYFKGLRETEDGIILVGLGQAQTLICRLDEDGGLIDMQRHGQGVLYSLVSCPAGFLASGSDAGNVLAMRLAENGNLRWRRVYDISGIAYGVARMPDEGFILCIASSGHRLLRIDRGGNEMWRRYDDDIRGNGWQSIVTNVDGAAYVVGDFNGSQGCLMKVQPDVSPPVIIDWTPSQSELKVLLGDSIDFAIVAEDIQDDSLWFRWSHNRDDLGVENDHTTLDFDELGLDTVKCSVFDSSGSDLAEWHVTVTDLYIQSFTPDTLNLTIRRGNSVDFAIDSVAAVGGNDDMQYLWTKTNLDNQGEPERSGEDAQATIPFLQSGNFAVEGLAYREQSSDAVVWNVAVSGAIWSFAPEDITLEVLPDSLVRFEVFPNDPDSVGWSIAWLVDGEVAREGETTLEWRFFGEADSCPPHLVQVVVADSVEADTVTWEVVARELGVGDEEAGRPGRPALLDVSPNPFNSMLTIKYTTGSAARPTRLAIYDVSGREVVRLVDGGSSVNPPWLTGRNSADRRGSAEETSSATWNASPFPAGVYLVRLQTGQEVSTKKVVLIR